MADVNDIVCLGVGSWSSVNSMPTLGFGSSAAVVVPSVGYPSWTLRPNLPQWELRENLAQWTLRPSLPQWELERED